MLRYLSFIGAFLLFGWTVARSEEPTAVEISKPVAFMNGGDFQRAIVAFNAIANEHRTVKVYLHRALCWSNLGKDVEAHTEIASAQSLPPKADVWHSDFVDIERVWGDIERSMLERPIVTARYLGNSRRAIELADMAVREAPSDAEIIFLRALAHLDEEQYSLALMDADEAVRHDPLNADRYKFRSLLLIWEHPKQIDKVRGLDAALADASEAVRLRPAADTYLHRARIHTFKKDFGHAADDFSKVLERSRAGTASRGSAFVCRAALRKHLGNDAGASRDFAEAQKLQPEILGEYDPFVAGVLSADDRLESIVTHYLIVGSNGFLLEELQQRRIARTK